MAITCDNFVVPERFPNITDPFFAGIEGRERDVGAMVLQQKPYGVCPEMDVPQLGGTQSQIETSVHAAWNRWQPYSKVGLETQFQDFQKVQLWNIGGGGTYPQNLGFNLQEKKQGDSW